MNLKEMTRGKIRELRGRYFTHRQIMDEMKIPEPTYWYHWGLIKKEDQAIYKRYTEENLKNELERAISGIEKKIQELNIIITDADDDKVKVDAIKTATELMVAIPRLMRDGGEIIGVRPSEGHTIQSDLKEPAK